jgi:hypothetical protein
MGDEELEARQHRAKTGGHIFDSFDPRNHITDLSAAV